MTSINAPQLSIIIPTLNEVEALPHLVNALTEQRNIRSQLIVADGGSTDGTTAWVEQQDGISLVHSVSGRGAQLNAGAETATAEWMLFLHADSLIKDPDLLSQALTASDPTTAGHFALRFFDRPVGLLKYLVLEEKTKLTRENTTNGDQGLLIHRDLFYAIGPYSTRWHFLEDQNINESLRKQGKLTLLPGEIYTSARRFQQEGFGVRYTVMTLLMTAWSCGLYSFIDDARDGYRQQSKTSKLSLLPFLLLFKQKHRQRPCMQRLSLLFSYGSYARRNVWQPLLWLDCRLFSGRKRPLVTIHDKLISPALRLPIVKQLVDIGLGTSICILIFYLAPLILQLRDGKPR